MGYLEYFLFIFLLLFFGLIFIQTILSSVIYNKIPTSYICSSEVTPFRNLTNLVFALLFIDNTIFLCFVVISGLFIIGNRENIYGFKSFSRNRLLIIGILVFLGMISIVNIAVSGMIFYILRTSTCSSSALLSQGKFINLMKTFIVLSSINFLIIIFVFVLFIFLQR